MGMEVKRFDVFLVNLDSAIGKEIQKTRPCLIISPDEMNAYIKTVIVAPMTTKGRPYPTRIECLFEKKEGQIILDQIRTVDKNRLVKKMGVLDPKIRSKVLFVLQELFAE